MGSVLIVDDHRNTGRATARLLRACGHETECAFGGREALAHLAAAAKLPDAVLLDATMPDMDGIEVLRRLRADPRTARLPVVMWSAVADPAHVAHARRHGANDYLVKTRSDTTDLLRRLRPFLSPP